MRPFGIRCISGSRAATTSKSAIIRLACCTAAGEFSGGLLTKEAVSRTSCGRLRRARFLGRTEFPTIIETAGEEGSGGTGGEAGSRFVERVPMVVAACRQQNRNVLKFLAVCGKRFPETRWGRGRCIRGSRNSCRYQIGGIHGMSCPVGRRRFVKEAQAYYWYERILHAVAPRPGRRQVQHGEQIESARGAFADDPP